MLSHSGILRIFHLKKTIGYTIIRVFLIQIFMLVMNYKEKAELIDVPLVAESPVTIECRIAEEKELGSHVMMTADVLSVHADSRYMDSKGCFALEKAKPIVYSHGTYFSLGKEIGTFGYSVRKK